jgi:thioredoxin reductase
VEAALALSEQPGNTVHLSYRGENIFRIKDLNRERLERFVEKGQIATLFNSTVTTIEDRLATVQQGDKTIELPNDYVFVFIGGELPTEFLKRVGIDFTRKHGVR